MRKLWAAILLTNLITAGLFLSNGAIQAHTKAQNPNQPSMVQCQHQMMKSLGAADQNYDLRFINAMIPHHEGAVKMAKDALKKAKHPEIKTMAQNIIEAQEKEIAQLKAWRKAWYGK